jgi:hypothetical protein
MESLDAVFKAIERQQTDGVLMCNVKSVQECCNTVDHPRWDITSNCSKADLAAMISDA